jgi:hypothetical protein
VTVPPVPFLAASGKSRRKRPRDECVSLFTVQPQQSTAFASVALFQTQNMVSSSPSPAATALVSTGLRLAFDEQQQQQQQESKQTNAFGYPSSPSQSGSVSDELAAQEKRHDEEIDRFVREQVPSPFPCTTPPALTSPSDPDAPYRTWRGPFLVTHSGRAAEAGGGRPAAAPQPGDPGQGRAVRGRQAPREGLGSGARGAARRRAGGAARAPPRRGGRVAGQGALGAGRRGHPARAAPAAGRRAGVGRGAARRRWRRRRRGAVLVVGVRGPSALGPRVPGLPPEAGLRRAHPLQAPPALRRVLRRRRRGRRHGVPRVPVRADGQRGGHPLLSVPRLAVHVGSR